MKKIIICNSSLGVITSLNGSMLWSSSILSKPEAVCFEPLKAVHFLKHAIPEEHAPSTFILSVDTERERLPHDHALMRPLSHLWMFKIVNMVITGQQNGQPVALTTQWRGTTEQTHDGIHLRDAQAMIKEKGITHATVYTDRETDLIKQAIDHLTRNATTPFMHHRVSFDKRIAELIEQIDPDEHPVKTACLLREVQALMAESPTLH